MTNTNTPEERRKLIWAVVHQQLVRYAVPDSRYHYDFLSFTPDFHGSSQAVDRLIDLPCYKTAKTLLVTPDNSLEQLRCRALRDGKKLLVATHRLRRGFVSLDPSRIDQSRYEIVATLDGMEKPGAGKLVSISQIRDEKLSIDMCIIGGLIFNQQGVTIWEGSSLFEVQWALLSDIKALAVECPVAALVHSCQVADEAQLGVDVVKPDKPGEVQCDYVVTPEIVLEIKGAIKPQSKLNFESLDTEAMQNIPPLQELKGIRMMENIMKDGGFGEEEAPTKTPEAPSAEEQLGIDMVEKLMRGYKA